MLAPSEPLDAEHFETELAAPLPELRAAEDVHSFAVRKVERERIELPAWHRRLEAIGAADVLEREEHLLPAILATELADLALDPDGREPLEIAGHAAIEVSDGIDRAVAVLDRLDLRHEG